MEGTDNFELLLAQKNHNEVVRILKELLVSLSKEESSYDDSNVVNALKSQSSKIEELIKTLQDAPEPKEPVVNVDVDQQGIIDSMKGICNDIIDSNNRVIEALENRPLPESFELIKSIGSGKKKVKVKYKKSKELL